MSSENKDSSKTPDAEDRSGNLTKTVPDAELNNSFNPSMFEDLQADELARVKGDAIGNTLYSERFVLSTLLKLTKQEKDLSEDENFEKDLCTLWDMTIEEDVVTVLLEHNVLELFANIIELTDDKRLTEILVGIIGNMCSVSKTRDTLCMRPDVIYPIIELIECSDTLTLIQLMRFFEATLVFENSGDEYMWFQHFKNCTNFVPSFSYILINSVNTTLLINAYEALNGICAKFAVIEIQDNEENSCFRDVFVQPCLVTGVIEAFTTLISQITECTDDDDTSGPTQKSQRIMSLFLDINVILSQYDVVSKTCYEETKNELMQCISKILSTISQPMTLFPLSTFQQGVIENTNEIFQALDDPFNGDCFNKMITIWNLIHSESNRKKNKSPSSTWENEDSDARVVFEDSVDPEDICNTIMEYIVRTTLQCTEENLTSTLNSISKEYCKNVLSTLLSSNEDPDIKDCYNKINSVIKKTENNV